MKKFVVLMFLLMMFLFTGCGKPKKEESDYGLVKPTQVENIYTWENNIQTWESVTKTW